MPLLNSPQIGSLFETLVVAEIVKFIRNYNKNWELFFWRTKEQEEVDLIIKTEQGKVQAFEIKYAIHGISRSLAYPPAFQKVFALKTPLVVVTAGGQPLTLSDQCVTLPIALLHDYLQGL
jgi:predicted AAA+ superfamily ATPase